MRESAKNYNAVITATKQNGYIALSISLEGCDNVSIKVNDFGGTQKARAKAISYKIYKSLGGK